MFKKIKIITLPALLLFMLGFQACKKYHGDTYDFSDAEKHYMNFRDTTKIAFAGTTPKNVVIATRVWFAEDLNVVINVAADNGASETVNVVYEAFGGTTPIKSVPITIPASFFPTGTSAISGKITLVSATGQKYGSLRMGYPALGQGINIPFTATK